MPPDDTRDLRDPEALGAAIGDVRRYADYHADTTGKRRPPLSAAVDAYPSMLNVADYHSNEGPLEKYGDPRKVAHRP